MTERKFYFSIKRVLFIVLAALLIGSTPFVFEHDSNPLLRTIMSIGGTKIIGYVLFGLSTMVGIFHVPNLIRALAKKPAVTVTDDFILLHQFPGRLIHMSELRDVSSELGSMLLKLEGGRKKWVNLKIVDSADDCVELIQSIIGRRVAAPPIDARSRGR